MIKLLKRLKTKPPFISIRGYLRCPESCLQTSCQCLYKYLKEELLKGHIWRVITLKSENQPNCENCRIADVITKK